MMGCLGLGRCPVPGGYFRDDELGPTSRVVVRGRSTRAEAVEVCSDLVVIGVMPASPGSVWRWVSPVESWRWSLRDSYCR